MTDYKSKSEMKRVEAIKASDYEKERDAAANFYSKNDSVDDPAKAFVAFKEGADWANERAKAENERLRAACEKIASYPTWPAKTVLGIDTIHTYGSVVERARKALAAEGD